MVDIRNLLEIVSYYSFSFENVLLLGEFNVSSSNDHMKNLCDMFELGRLIKKSTCFKSSTQHILTISIPIKKRFSVICIQQKLESPIIIA